MAKDRAHLFSSALFKAIGKLRGKIVGDKFVSQETRDTPSPPFRQCIKIFFFSEQVDQMVAAAMKKWSDVTPLTWRPGSGKTDIRISWDS